MMMYLWLLTVFLVWKSAFPLHAEETSHQQESTHDSSDLPASKAMAESKDENNYKTLPPLIISIVKEDKIYGYLRLELQLATKDGKAIEQLKPLYPILMDAYTTKLYSLIGDRWIPDHPLPPESILKIVQDATDKITQERLKNTNIKVYLKNFFFFPANK